jgi:hypothetical protein
MVSNVVPRHLPGCKPTVRGVGRSRHWPRRLGEFFLKYQGVSWCEVSALIVVPTQAAVCTWSMLHGAAWAKTKKRRTGGGGGAFIDEAICLHMGLDATAQRLCNSHLEAVQHLNTQLLNVVRILSISLRYAAPARIMRRVGERSTVTTESSTRVPTAPSGVLHCRVHPARTATKQTNSMVTSVTVVSVGKPGDIRSTKEANCTRLWWLRGTCASTLWPQLDGRRVSGPGDGAEINARRESEVRRIILCDAAISRCSTRQQRASGCGSSGRVGGRAHLASMAVALDTRRTRSRSHDAPCAIAWGNTVTPDCLLMP